MRAGEAKNRIGLPRREEKAAHEIVGGCVESARMEVVAAAVVVGWRDRGEGWMSIS
jgi:hypothetical protein